MTDPADNRGAHAIQARKAEHLAYAREETQTTAPTGFGDVELLHRALPEIDFDAVDLGVEFLGRRQLGAPLVIAGMTGGHRDAERINRTLARAAERHGLAMGLGSQRAALRDPAVAYTYEAVRQEAPHAFLVANVGAAQLVDQDGEAPLFVGDVRRAVEMVAADALAVHLNFLEEVVQPEGDRCAAGCLAAIARLTEAVEVPVIAKETGSGIAAETAEQLIEAGIVAIDVGGCGGTSFAAVESRRAADRGDVLRAQLGESFRDWGVPTPVAVADVAGFGVPVIATGGVRTGLDAAKAIALGATLVGVARPFLIAADRGDDAVDAYVELFTAELRTAAFLTGSSSMDALRRAPYVVLGDTREWLVQRR